MTGLTLIIGKIPGKKPSRDRVWVLPKGVRTPEQRPLSEISKPIYHKTVKKSLDYILPRLKQIPWEHRNPLYLHHHSGLSYDDRKTFEKALTAMHEGHYDVLRF